MPGWRERKARMLATVHRTFEVEGVYLTHAGGTGVRANCRIHRKPTVDALSFADFSDAARSWATEDVLVFDLAQVPNPLPDAFFIVSPTEGYKLGSAKPAQDGYQYVSVNVMAPTLLNVALSQVDPADPLWVSVFA